METKTVIRLVMALFILALAMGIASPPAYAACGAYTSCEHNCMPREEACVAGLTHPECAGDWNCCNQKLSRCWECCIWY